MTFNAPLEASMAGLQEEEVVGEGGEYWCLVARCAN